MENLPDISELQVEKFN